MNIEIAPSRFPTEFGPAVLDVGSAGSRIIAILDGTGSWEAGDEEARAVADFLRTAWAANLPGSAAEVVRDLATATDRLLPAPLNESFGRAAFSFSAVAVMPNGHAFVVSCGSYATLHVQEAATEVLYRPLFWIDEQVRSGTLTRHEASSHQLRHVYIGPLLSRDATAACKSVGPIRAGKIVLATMELARHLLRISAAAWSHLSVGEIQELEQDGSAHMRPVVVINLDAA